MCQPFHENELECFRKECCRERDSPLSLHIASRFNDQSLLSPAKPKLPRR